MPNSFFVNVNVIEFKTQYNEDSLPFVKDDGGTSFSYQKRSDLRISANWWARMHPNVGPTTAPFSGVSARAPT